MASTEDSPSSSKTKSKAPKGSAFAAQLKKEERLARLKRVHQKMEGAKRMNHQAVVEEDRRKELPKNWESRQERVQKEEEEEQQKSLCLAEGEDYERTKLLEIGASDSAKWHRKRKKADPDPGFSSYEDMTRRQYSRSTKQMKPDLQHYERKRATTSDELFYPSRNTLGVEGEHKDTDDAINNMVDDLEKQISKRGKFHRRRMHDEEADIDYINSRNAKFNSKLERFYGEYTTEIKQNLERGTAI